MNKKTFTKYLDIFRKTKKLDSLYLENKRLKRNKDQHTQEENIRIDHLITIIFRLKYKFITQLKSRQL